MDRHKTPAAKSKFLNEYLPRVVLIFLSAAIVYYFLGILFSILFLIPTTVLVLKKPKLLRLGNLKVNPILGALISHQFILWGAVYIGIWPFIAFKILYLVNITHCEWDMHTLMLMALTGDVLLILALLLGEKRTKNIFGGLAIMLLTSSLIYLFYYSSGAYFSQTPVSVVSAIPFIYFSFMFFIKLQSTK